jgi:type II secretory pathway component PulF
MQFAYSAITPEGRLVSESVEASSVNEAADSLRGRGLMVTRIQPSA